MSGPGTTRNRGTHRRQATLRAHWRPVHHLDHPPIRQLKREFAVGSPSIGFTASVGRLLALRVTPSYFECQVHMISSRTRGLLSGR